MEFFGSLGQIAAEDEVYATFRSRVYEPWASSSSMAQESVNWTHQQRHYGTTTACLNNGIKLFIYIRLLFEKLRSNACVSDLLLEILCPRLHIHARHGNNKHVTQDLETVEET